MKRLAAVWAVVGFLFLVNPATANAHAVLLGTTPGADEVLPSSPSSVELTFNEPVQPAPGRIRILDSSGVEQRTTVSSVDATVRIAVPAELTRGSYLVDWRAVSADGHPISGAFVFSVGAATELSASPESPDATWLSTVKRLVDICAYLGILALIGLAVFRQFGLVGGLTCVVRALRRWIWAAAVVVCGMLVAQIPIAARLDGFIPTDVLIAAGFGIAGSILVLLGRVPTVLGVVALAAALPAVGHTHTFGPVPVVMATDLLHVLAAGTWFGGLIGLLITVRHASSIGWPQVARVVGRFSTIAAALAATVVLTGGVLAWRILGSWAALLDSHYGKLLLVKLALAGAVLAIAVYNRLVIVPSEHRTSRLRWTVTAEIVVLVLVVCVTGFLSAASPHSPTASTSPVGQSDTGNQLTIHAGLTHQRVGPNSIYIHVSDLAGRPAKLVAPPEIELRPDGSDIGPIRVVATPVADGEFSASVNLPLSATWELTVNARASKYESESSTFEVSTTGQ